MDKQDMDISWLIYIEYRKIEGKWKRQIVDMSMIDSDRKREKEGEGGEEREREKERGCDLGGIL